MKSSTITHPNQQNSLLNQVLSETNLDQAMAWLTEAVREQDNSDVWHFLRDWDNHKVSLRQRLESNTFSFQVVREVETTNADGRCEFHEIRVAEDRLLIRAISQIIRPAVLDATPKRCTHLFGRGGIKAAVKDTQAYLNQHPDSFVYKSDVKSYYASIAHRKLHQQLCELFPNEPKLCRVFWLFMQRTIERGGYYREASKGIPLGASLSPLFAAVYLIPLDKAMCQHSAFFYRRFMDDWVIVCHSRRQLRNLTQEVYTIMKSLHVDIHPKKTWLGRAKHGFDFLGFRITPTRIQPSAQSVSRRDDNIARLYEQGASKKRIEQYLKRWLGWCIFVVPLTGHGLEITDGFQQCSYNAQETLQSYNRWCGKNNNTTATNLSGYFPHSSYYQSGYGNKAQYACDNGIILGYNAAGQIKHSSNSTGERIVTSGWTSRPYVVGATIETDKSTYPHNHYNPVGPESSINSEIKIYHLGATRSGEICALAVPIKKNKPDWINGKLVPLRTKYSLFGKVNGLPSGASIMIKDTESKLEANGSTMFEIPETTARHGKYSVTVTTGVPKGYECTVNNGGGDNVTRDVTDIEINCKVLTYHVKGVVSGLSNGESVTLTNDRNNEMLKLSVNGGFDFTQPFEHGQTFSISSSDHPTGKTCTVTNGAINNIVADVTNVKVECSDKTYTVSFNLQGHGSTIGTLDVVSGKKVTVPTAPSETGFTFDGWFIDAAGTKPYDFTTVVNGDMTLYAKWTVSGTNPPPTTNTTSSIPSLSSLALLALMSILGGFTFVGSRLRRMM